MWEGRKRRGGTEGRPTARDTVAGTRGPARWSQCSGLRGDRGTGARQRISGQTSADWEARWPGMLTAKAPRKTETEGAGDAGRGGVIREEAHAQAGGKRSLRLLDNCVTGSEAHRDPGKGPARAGEEPAGPSAETLAGGASGFSPSGRVQAQAVTRCRSTPRPLTAVRRTSDSGLPGRGHTSAHGSASCLISHLNLGGP